MTTAWPLAFLVGESGADRLCRFVRSFDGVSLDEHDPYVSHDEDSLRQLVNRGVSPDSLREWTWYSNCGESAIGFLAAACGSVDAARDVHALLATPGAIGSSIARIYQMGEELGAMLPYTGGAIQQGSLVSYAHGQHVEWVLSDFFAHNGQADHGGGGRARNAITVGRGDVRSSLGRPATEIFYFPPLLPASPDPATGELERVLVGFTDGNATAEGG